MDGRLGGLHRWLELWGLTELGEIAFTIDLEVVDSEEVDKLDKLLVGIGGRVFRAT